MNLELTSKPLLDKTPLSPTLRPRIGAPEQDEEKVLARNAQVGRHVVLEVLGRGGMGVVYSAYDPQLDRKVALKVLRFEAARGTASRQRLIREAQAVARLSHPNVINVYDVGQWREQVFVTLEFVDGGTLADWVQERRRHWREVLAVFIEAGHGLAAAHRAGLVHRDFKPDNVLIGSDGRARVTDFGLARRLGEAEPSVFLGCEDTPTHALTATGTLLGTPAYMAPEQFRGQPADARSDQFSFCVALYEALYGTRPFPGKTVHSLSRAVMAGQLRPTPDVSGVPGWLGRVLRRGLATDPADRFANLDALLDELAFARRAARARRFALPVLAAVAAAANLMLVLGHHSGLGSRSEVDGGAAFTADAARLTELESIAAEVARGSALMRAGRLQDGLDRIRPAAERAERLSRAAP